MWPIVAAVVCLSAAPAGERHLAINYKARGMVL